MLSEILSSSGGVILPIISLISTLAVFVGIIVWAIRMDKKLVTRLKHLPLESTDNPEPKGGSDRV